MAKINLTENNNWAIQAEASIDFGELKLANEKNQLLLRVGIGNKKLSAFQVRKLLHKATTFLCSQGATVQEIDFAKKVGHSESFIKTCLLEANYKFEKYKSKKTKLINFNSLLGSAQSKEELQIATSINLAKDLVEEPTNHMTPKHLADYAAALAKRTNGLTAKILDKKACEKLGLTTFLTVAQASVNEPYLIELNYKPSRAKASQSKSRNEGFATQPGSRQNHVGLIGKGLCYDTGGLCLKPNNYMFGMKSDMAGAATVIAVMKAVAELKLAVPVTALVLACENSFGDNSYRPGDVIKTLSGKTVEVVDTDAEGRLTLADAITFLSGRKEIKTIIDYATLTGSCAVSFGEKASGAFTNSPKLLQQFAKAAERTGEPIWELPLFEEFLEDLKSPIADLLQCDGRPDASMAAIFLKEFLVGKQDWLHLDIAGTAFLDEENDYLGIGATGRGVWSTVEFLRDLASSK